MKEILSKICNSSTWWVSVLLIVGKVVADKFGILIPWEAIAGGQVAYGVKEAASKISR